MKLNHWYNFLLTLLFWVFTWETYSALVEKYKLSVNQNFIKSQHVIYSYCINYKFKLFFLNYFLEFQ